MGLAARKLRMTPPAAAGGWTPADIPNLVDWWLADDAGSITDAGGGKVSAWAGQEGVATLSQGTDANRPITGTRTINSRNALDFNGTSQYMDSNAVINERPAERSVLFVGLRDADGSPNGTTIAGGIEAANWSTDINNSELQRIVSANTELIATATNPVTNGVAFQSVITRAQSGALYSFFLDGSANGSGSNGSNWSTTTDHNTMRVGRHFNAQDWWDGLMACLVIVDGIVDSTDLAEWDSYCARWGL